MKITPDDATLGPVVADVNLGKELDDATFASIETTQHERGVLIFPQQGLSNEDHIEFSCRSGVLERSIKEEDNRHPEIITLSNLRADRSLWPHKSNLGLFLAGNRGWHPDTGDIKLIPPPLRKC